MGSTAESAVPPLMPPDPGQPPGFPFRGPGLLVRVAPFAVVTVLAEVSLALPPGVQSQSAVIASIVLLLAVAGSFALPWRRLPAWATVLVPLAYTGWVLALILAAGETAGVGIVILVPLVWTALFHQRWESACVVVAIVTVEVITSLVPTAAADSVITRRVLLWAGLGTLISVATHGLRDRIAHSQRESARLQEQLREVTVLQDRDRIAQAFRTRSSSGSSPSGWPCRARRPRPPSLACGSGSKPPPVTWIRCCGCCGIRSSAWSGGCVTAGCAGKSWSCARACPRHQRSASAARLTVPCILAPGPGSSSCCARSSS